MFLRAVGVAINELDPGSSEGLWVSGLGFRVLFCKGIFGMSSRGWGQTSQECHTQL